MSRPLASRSRVEPACDSAPAAKAGPDFLSRAYWNGTIKMSLSKFFILRVLHHRPMHGYDVARAVEATTNGCCSPTEGTIYPVLREFEDGGYVTSASEVVSGRERRVYTLTPKGRAAFKVAVAAWLDVTRCLLDAGKMIGAPADEGEGAASCCS